MTLHKRDVERLEAFEVWIWSRMMRMSWTEQKTNEEMLQTVGLEKDFIGAQRARQKRWLGHVHAT